MNDYKVGAVASFASIFRYTFPLIGILSTGVAAWLTVDENDFKFVISAFVVVFGLLVLYVLYQIYVKNKRIYEDFG